MNLKLKSKFFSFFKAAFFVAGCFVVSIAVILPLWAFASNAPRIYSGVVLALIAAFLLCRIIIWAKKAGAKKAFRISLKCLVVTAGIFACFYFLLTFRRLFSLAALLAAAVLFKVIDFLLK